ncbi:MAG: RimK family protein [Myxococcales bacterium]|nr:RimK family protein [Myxococcales bacterium]
MSVLVVLDRTDRGFDLRLEDAEVISARDYLGDPRWSALRRAKVFNLCSDYRYQRVGYYVSLLAAARGHRPLPSVATLQELTRPTRARSLPLELTTLIERNLAPLKGDTFELSIYFGRNVAKRYDRLARALFNHLPAPLLRATFVRRDDRWQLRTIRPIASGEIPDSHRDFVEQRARDYFARGRAPEDRPRRSRFDLAVLLDEEAEDAPSDEAAIKRLIRAARKRDVAVTLIDKDDFGRLAEFDALFIRETTAVNHHTYRFSRRAHSEGLVVIDDPESILRCSNKVYQAELFARSNISAPRTALAHRGRDNSGIGEQVGFPCVVKQPDSAFSRGVFRANDAAELDARLRELLDSSDLVVVQEFVASSFDWRVGVLGGEALFAARYNMAPHHWQVRSTDRHGRSRYGRVDPVPLAEAPQRVISLALRAAHHIGDGLYGVDIKEVGRRLLVMEVNDNPNIDAGCEDAELGPALYERIIDHFATRIERTTNGAHRSH